MILAALLAFAAPAPTSAPIVLGMSYRWNSPVMHEERVVNVVLPDDYATKPDARYPVLYVIDGGVDQDLVHISGTEKLGAAWGRSADAIIVEVDRARSTVMPR